MTKRRTFRGLVLVVLLMLGVLNAWAEDSLEEAVLSVRGMSGTGCEYGVTQALQKVDGVSAVKVDYKTGQAQASYDAAKTTPQALVDAIRELGYAAEVKGAANDSHAAAASTPTSSDSCSTAEPTEIRSEGEELTDAEIDKVADYLAERIMATGLQAFSSDEIQEATGVLVTDATASLVQTAVITKLADLPGGLEKLSGSRCATYEACSLFGDLSGATGEILAMYERERQEDGTEYDDFALPNFEAHDLAGKTVASADLKGHPALLAFLAGHCRHSMDSFPILKELQTTYGTQGLQIVAVLVNSGSVEDANSWVHELEPNYDVWVFNDASLGDLIQSHLVPTYLFVDAQGQVTEKLVGFKDRDVMVKRVASRMPQESSETTAAADR